MRSYQCENQSKHLATGAFGKVNAPETGRSGDPIKFYLSATHTVSEKMPHHRPILRLRPGNVLDPNRARELWRARDLVWFLAMRDLKLRYKQTALGVVWAVLPPLFAMLLFTAVFGKVLGKTSGDVPYPLLCLTALVPWQVFSVALAQSSLSLSSNQQLVTKIWFPRLVLPLASSLSPLTDAFISSSILVGAVLWSGRPIPATIFLLPVLAVMPLFAALSFSLWLAALNAHFRDVRNILPFLIQGWMFATPVVYPLAILSPEMRRLVELNPMTTVVETYRWAVLGTSPPTNLLTVALVLLAAFFGGILFFVRMERTLADVV